MCGRYAITSPPEAVREFAGYMDRPNFPPRYNIAPTQPVPIIRQDDGVRQFSLVRWGLVPSWSKQVNASNPLINARAETIFEKPSFKNAIRRRRCLFPLDGFYEWYRGAPRRQAYYVRARDHGLYAIGGVWEYWTSADGSELESAAMITTEANGTLAPIHHRMPVIIAPSEFDRWLSTDETEAREVSDLLAPSSDDLLEAVAISDRVNKVANDDPDVQTPVTLDESGLLEDDPDTDKDNDQLSLF